MGSTTMSLLTAVDLSWILVQTLIRTLASSGEEQREVCNVDFELAEMNDDFDFPHTGCCTNPG